MINKPVKKTKQVEKAKVMLVILDGWGLGKEYDGNAIFKAKTPFFDKSWRKHPHAILKTSGKQVGLPSGQMGTSEVNHQAIGAGRVIKQDLLRINEAIKDKSFFKNKTLRQAFDFVKKNDSRLHLWGLLSDGGVHSHIDHWKATLKAAKQSGIETAYLHLVTDGRDTDPNSGIHFIKELQGYTMKLKIGKISTVIGRYFAMDREKNWNRTEKAYKLYTQGKGVEYNKAVEALQLSYGRRVTDEFVEPILIDKKGVFKEGDALVMVNFRSDRPRQLARKIQEKGPNSIKIVTMTQYNSDFPIKVMFEPKKIENTLGEVLSKAGLKQLRITETEKFAHLTFFMNCKREKPYKNEDRVMLDSYSDIKTHDERPKMRTPDIAEKVIKDIQKGQHEVIFVNICNADMVGHTGNIKATISACETVDKVLSKMISVAQKHEFNILITADHGNAEQMLTKKGRVITAHSTNPAPLILISNNYSQIKYNKGKLSDLAPTILKILGLTIPDDMTGKSFV